MPETEKSAYFRYTGTVRGQGRPKFARCGSAVYAYESAKDRDYKQALATAYAEQCGGVSFGGAPVAVNITVMRALPKSKPKRVKCEEDTKKPDIDNIVKAVLDALVMAGCFDDDSQVIELSACKLPRARDRYDEDTLIVTVREKHYEEDGELA
jgi:Holliday junction resolvase RusA-like endonuclease